MKLHALETIPDSDKLHREALQGLAYALFDSPQPLCCRRCGASFTPASQQFIFYTLCDACFALFDEQKMAGRIASLEGEAVHYYEDADAWIITHPCRSIQGTE
jgi:hypothetical protein